MATGDLELRLALLERDHKERYENCEKKFDLQRESMTRLDEKMNNMASQSQAHMESTSRAMGALEEKINKFKTDIKVDIETAIAKVTSEVKGSLDKITRCLGIDDDPHSILLLRSNLKDLNVLVAERNEEKEERKHDRRIIRRGIYSIVITGVAAIMIIGIKAFLG